MKNKELLNEMKRLNNNFSKLINIITNREDYEEADEDGITEIEELKELSGLTGFIDVHLSNISEDLN